MLLLAVTEPVTTAVMALYSEGSFVPIADVQVILSRAGILVAPTPRTDRKCWHNFRPGAQSVDEPMANLLCNVLTTPYCTLRLFSAG